MIQETRNLLLPYDTHTYLFLPDGGLGVFQPKTVVRSFFTSYGVNLQSIHKSLILGRNHARKFCELKALRQNK